MSLPDADAALLYDVAAIREAESRARMGGDGDDVLMQRAGQAAWRAALERWPQAVRILVACGPGNNGGDGYVLARLALESGRDVRACQVGKAPTQGAAWRMREAYLAAGGRSADADVDWSGADLLVDAVFGIGLSRAPDGDLAEVIAAMNRARTPVLALDVPSGIDADRGCRPGVAVHATATVQFLAAHAGLYTGDALEHVGALSVARLDVAQHTFDGIAPVAALVDAGGIRRHFRPRPRNAHKGGGGHVLCVGGDLGHGGAIILCADAALRAGCGLASVATRAEHVGAVLARRPEAMARAVDSPRSLSPLLGAADTIAIGPGLGQGSWSSGLLDAVLACGKPLVLDADALNLVAAERRALPADAILTPHPGEAARLLGCSAADVQADRLSAARSLGERHGCVVVLKGAGTIVTAPGMLPRVIGAGNPGMAVGGMGDLLTGIIASLRAQGRPAFEAAWLGALVHAAAGDAAATDGGRGLLPSDLLMPLRRLVNP